MQPWLLLRWPTPSAWALASRRPVQQRPALRLPLPSLQPPLLLPRKGKLGLIDYEKMFCPDLKTGRDIFDLRGIDRQKGCMVIVRPDQYVAHILPIDAYVELAEFFAGVLLAQV